MELVENDTMTEEGQGEFEVYESRNSKNKRLQKERRQLELEAEAVEQDLLRQLPGNQQEDVRHHGPGRYPGGRQEKHTTWPPSCLPQTTRRQE